MRNQDVDEDEEEDELDEDSDTPPYSITYVVPFGSASRTLSLPNTTNFSNFLDAVAERMAVSKSHLSSLAYRPSWLPNTSKAPPVLIEDEEAYEHFMTVVDTYR